MSLRAETDVVARRFRPVGLEDIAGYAHGTGNLPHGAVAVTSDDGFGDNARVAVPILRHFVFGTPARERDMSEIVFLVAAGTIAFTYLGYPAIVSLFALAWGRPSLAGATPLSMTVLIAAHNEEAAIAGTVEGMLALDAPAAPIDVLVVSDGSTDRTDAIVGRYADRGVRLVRTPARLGKTGAQRFALAFATGDVVVFADATVRYATDCLVRLASRFGNPDVGGVEGRLVYRRNTTGHLGGKDLAKSFEARVKTAESAVYGGVGDNGACYAIRRELCRPLPDNLTSDLAGPLDVLRQGFRFVFEPTAISEEEAAESWQAEFRRKIRTVRAGVHVVLSSRDLLNPWRHPWTSFVLIGRKISRWLAAWMLPVALLASAAAMKEPFYAVAFALQASGWGFALIGMVFPGAAERVRLLCLARAFLAVNAAAVIGSAQAVLRGNSEVWTPSRVPS